MADQKPIPVILGPTASGKTSVGILLAQYLDGEVISGVTGTAFKIPMAGAQNQAGDLMIEFPRFPVFVAGGTVFIQR